jgi:hypothetical protein
MWGGEISSNTGDGSGGGVVNDAFFYMHGGEISGNRTNAGMGGGVYNGNPGYDEDGIFIITGGVIYGNGDKQTPPAPNPSLDNIDRGGGSQGGALYILGGTVAWAEEATTILTTTMIFNLKKTQDMKILEMILILKKG